MRRALSAIANENRIGLLARQPHDIRDRIDRPQRVRHMIECDDFRALVEQSAQKLKIDPAIGSQLANPEFRALLRGKHLPRDEVRVMIEGSHDYLVTARDVRLSPRSGDEIQSFRGAARKNEAVRIARAKETRDSYSRIVIALGRPYGERVCSAMGIRVRRLVEILQRVENRLRLL